MTKIKLQHVSKQYTKESDKVIHDFNLDIDDKEFIVFVGPSGCGKSTTLRMIAGLESITGGELWMDDQLVNHVPSKDRDIAMVFQNYALFPHLTVFDNIAFGLKIRKVKKAIIKEKVEQTAGILGLTPYLKRKPKDLSGGQKQRVALGRAVVRDANIFLMDEPLSNLDAKLRVQMREEIIRLHKTLGTTTIYVTHDQTEAMTMATRIVVLKDGHIQQIGTPTEIYKNPNNMFVASFIGAPAMNFIHAKVVNNQLMTSEGKEIAPLARPIDHQGKVILGIRPESVVLATENDGLAMDVEFVEMMGADLHVHGKLEQSKIIIRLNPDVMVKENDRIYLRFPHEKIHLFDPNNEESLYQSEGMTAWVD
ncbi:ABC transporter ATP-binding protein [Oceanobacillus saliphilus]|uniref:ABC transporter ATP-binding protein n=1 Tax=Oceanobacillus saliphilus TaxID=2925834 RepID=UPI00201E423D|nr:sn-glycerol-3-phosphate ABC transporter ATP-binding protein UgpC [Oceanobacillus saliphilus]